MNFNEIFRKDIPYDNFKIHKKPGFHPLEDTIFEKPQGGGGQIDDPAIEYYKQSQLFSVTTTNAIHRYPKGRDQS